MNKSLNSNHKTEKPSPIQLRDTGSHGRTMKASMRLKQHINIRATHGGVKISIPERKAWLYGGVGYLLIAGFMVIQGGVVSWNGMVFGIIGCGLLAKFFRRQKICIAHDTMTMRTGILRRKRTYTLRDIWNVRFDDREHRFEIAITSRRKASQRCNLLVDYGTGEYQQGYIIPYTIRCCHSISREEAERLVILLSDILTFHCHSVERIIFGECHVPESESLMTLQNPDVSTLTTPFFHLKHVDIYAETYDFHQVERFLTYAVNYIGQEYLKKHVEVHIYGDTEKLEPNLYNNFQNLCKGIHLKEHFSYE